MRRSLLLLIGVGLGLPITTRAQSAPSIQPGSRVWLTGTSNIRPFTCRSRAVGGRLVLAPGSAHTLAGGEISVPAASLGCGIHAQTVHLRETLRAAEHPEITFRITSYRAIPRYDATTLWITGYLRIAGVEREVVLPAEAAVDAAGLLHVLGEQTLDVTDYGVVPPRRFAGLLRVRRHATVHWDVVLDGGLQMPARERTADR